MIPSLDYGEGRVSERSSGRQVIRVDRGRFQNDGCDGYDVGDSS